MSRPSLHVVLSSVLAAAVDGGQRPALLATLHQDGNPVAALPRQRGGDSDGEARPPARPGKPSRVIPMPRVIPLPRREPQVPPPDHPDPAA